MINFGSLNENEWNHALALYNAYLSNDEKASRDARVTITNAEAIRSFSSEEFLDYLKEDFFVWKYTAANRLKTTLSQLAKMTPAKIDPIKRGLENSNKTDRELIETAMRIKGLGLAGATALLSTLYPHRFATIDQFVVKNLQDASSPYATDPIIIGTNPTNIRLNEGLYILRIIQNKANDLNAAFGKKTWTPRAIDKAIWADR